MIRETVIAGFAIACFAMNYCGSDSPRNTSSENQISTNENRNSSAAIQEKYSEEAASAVFTNGKVNYKGITFNFNTQIFSKVEITDVEESVMNSESDIPGGEYPQHSRFKFFDKDKRDLGTVVIYSTEEFRRMYEVSKDYQKTLDEDFSTLNDLRRISLIRQLKNEDLTRMQLLGIHQKLKLRLRALSFLNGGGYFFLVRYSQDYGVIVSNEELVYIYQGITNDKKYYVLGRFNPYLPFLPYNDSAKEFEDYKSPERYEDFSKTEEKVKYDKYLAKIASRIDKVAPEEFQPDLKVFDEILSSLNVSK